jgi:hypothetical protein
MAAVTSPLRVRWAVHVAGTTETKISYNILLMKHAEKILHGRPMLEWNIKMVSLCLSTSPWRVWGSGSKAPRIFNLGTRWRWVFSFTLQPFHPRVKGPEILFHKSPPPPTGQFSELHVSSRHAHTPFKIHLHVIFLHAPRSPSGMFHRPCSSLRHC